MVSIAITFRKLLLIIWTLKLCIKHIIPKLLSLPRIALRQANYFNVGRDFKLKIYLPSLNWRMLPDARYGILNFSANWGSSNKEIASEKQARIYKVMFPKGRDKLGTSLQQDDLYCRNLILMSLLKLQWLKWEFLMLRNEKNPLKIQNFQCYIVVGTRQSI